MALKWELFKKMCINRGALKWHPTVQCMHTILYAEKSINPNEHIAANYRTSKYMYSQFHKIRKSFLLWPFLSFPARLINFNNLVDLAEIVFKVGKFIPFLSHDRKVNFGTWTSKREKMLTRIVRNPMTEKIFWITWAIVIFGSLATSYIDLGGMVTLFVL